MKHIAGMYQAVWLQGWIFIAHMFRAAHKQWEVAVLILIKMDNWLNLNECPCWDSIRDPFRVQGRPMNRWTTLPPKILQPLDYATS